MEIKGYEYRENPVEQNFSHHMMATGMQTARIRQISADFLKVFVLLSFLPVLSTAWMVSRDLATGVVSGKYFWFYGCMGLTSLATFIFSWIHKKAFRFSLTDVLLVLFAGSVYVSAFVLNDASQNTTKLVLFALLIVLYFCFRLILNGAPKLKIFCCIFILLTGLVEAVWGLRQLYGFSVSQHSLFKLTGSFFNPGPYAGYLAVVAPLAVYSLFNSKHEDTKAQRHEDNNFLKLRVFVPSRLRVYYYLSAITLTTTLLVLPATMSRAAWLAAIAGSLVVVLPKYRHRVPCTLHRVPVICTILILITAALLGMYHLKKPSADGRLLTWKISLMTVVKHPFGVGLGHFSGAYGEGQAAYFASGMASEQEELVAGAPEYGFNEYLQILTESGIVSFLLFAGIIVCAFRSMLRAKDWGGAGALTALLVFAGFSYPFSVLPFLILFVFLIQPACYCEDKVQCHQVQQSVMSVIARAKPEAIQNELNKLDCFTASRFAMTSASIILLFAVSFCLYKQYPVYQAYKQWKTNQIYYQAGLFKDTAREYATLYPYLNDQIRFLFEYAQCLSKSEQAEKSNEVLQRATQISCDPMLYNIMGKNYQALKQYDRAEAAYIKAIQLIPNRIYPWYLLTKLYVETGRKEKAAETAKTVLTKEPKVQSKAIEEMREEMRKL